MKQKDYTSHLLLLGLLITFGVLAYLVITESQQAKEVKPEESFKTLYNASNITIVMHLNYKETNEPVGEEMRQKVFSCAISLSMSLGYSNKYIEPFSIENGRCYSQVPYLVNATQRECDDYINKIPSNYRIYIYPTLNQAQAKFYRDKLELSLSSDSDEMCSIYIKEQ